MVLSTVAAFDGDPLRTPGGGNSGAIRGTSLREGRLGGKTRRARVFAVPDCAGAGEVSQSMRRIPHTRDAPRRAEAADFDESPENACRGVGVRGLLNRWRLLHRRCPMAT